MAVEAQWAVEIHSSKNIEKVGKVSDFFLTLFLYKKILVVFVSNLSLLLKDFAISSKSFHYY